MSVYKVGQTATGVESTELVKQLREQKDHLARLVASSPNGILAVDSNGIVTVFNERLTEILGYNADEVLGKPVDRLYTDPDEPRKIGRLLQEASDGKLTNYETFVRSKGGDKIPIRLSATWLYDVRGQRVGNVGYFEDLRFIKETERRIDLLLKASNVVAHAENLTEGLQNLAEMMITFLPVTLCHVLLLDESQQFLVAKAAYPIPRPNVGGVRWEPGIGQRIALVELPGAAEILKEGHLTVLRLDNDRTRPVLEGLSTRLALDKPFQSLLLIPLRTREQTVGLLILGEMRQWERSPFTPEKQELAAAIAAQTAILIDRMRLYEITRHRTEELEHLHYAARAMAGAMELRHVLQTIVESAREVLHADSAAIWSYDAARDKFVPDELVTVGIPEDEFKRSYEMEPQPGRTAHTVMHFGWIGVTDLLKPEYDFLGQSTRELLARTGVMSFQGIALKVGDETLGVLYVNYKQPRVFGEDDRRSLESFATYAALAFKKARLLEQVSKAKKAAEVVAQVTALGDREATLLSVAQGTQEALGCDAVTLFVYDEVTGKLEHAPTMVGVLYPDRSRILPEVSPASIVYSMLGRDEPYIVERIAEDALFKDRRFARDEGIESCMAIPLKAAGQEVGVMFVNYRTRHRFTVDELSNIELFANQAAVAIRNAQLFDQAQRRIGALQTLFEANRVITGSLELGDILNRIAEQAWNLAGQAGFANIRLIEDTKAMLVASYPEEELTRVRAILGEAIDLATGINGRIGVPGRAILTGKSQLVSDVTGDPDYLESRPGTRSQLSAPIRVGDRVIGVISVEHPALNAFDKEDQHTLEALAAQAAVPILNAALYNETKKRADTLQALYEAGKTITSTLALEETLNRIAEQAIRIVGRSGREERCFSHVALLEGNELRFVAASTPRALTDLLNNVDEIDLNASPRIGITGRAAKIGQTQNVGDVSKDVDYVGFEVHIQSGLAVPIKLGDRILGVISIEDSEPNAFTTEDEQNVELLAAQAAVAIANARQYDELRKTKGLVGARTALAWMGMVSSTWRHSIEGHAINIRNTLILLRQELKRTTLSTEVRKGAEEKLSRIESLAIKILEKPIIPPVSSEEGVRSVAINDLIRERMAQLKESPPYKAISIQLNLAVDGATIVRISPDWLVRVLDILVDNAIEAMATSSVRSLTIKTQIANGGVEIAITDTAPGIPPQILEKLFNEPIEKPPGGKGLGMGLLMAQAIVQTYGGDIRLESTGPAGTTMVIWLPLER